jgi:hypothetical protein
MLRSKMVEHAVEYPITFCKGLIGQAGEDLTSYKNSSQLLPSFTLHVSTQLIFAAYITRTHARTAAHLRVGTQTKRHERVLRNFQSPGFSFAASPFSHDRTTTPNRRVSPSSLFSTRQSIATMADNDAPVTLRTRKFIRNPLLGRKQMVV